MDNELLRDFKIPENTNRIEFFVYLKIIFLPLLVFVLFLLLHLNKDNAKFEVILGLVVMLFFVFLFARHSAEFGCFRFERKKNNFQRDLKDYILKNLITISKETKSNAKFDDFVASYVSDVRSDSYASIGSWIFPMLGIFWTFLSICINLPDFKSTDAVALEFEISNLLKNISSAFYLAIYGVFLGLWWVFFEKSGFSRFQKLINRQKTATQSFFWDEKDLNYAYLKETLSSFTKVSKVFEYVSNQEFFKELDNAVERKFSNFMKLIDNEENAVKISAEHIKHTMSDIAKAQKDQKDLAKVHSDIVNAIYSFNQNLRQIQLNFSEQYNRAQSLSDEKFAKLEKAIIAFSQNIINLEEILADKQKPKIAKEILQDLPKEAKKSSKKHTKPATIETVEREVVDDSDVVYDLLIPEEIEDKK